MLGNNRKGQKAMFELGQTVVYGAEGVCIIDRVEEMKVNRVRTKYYVLKPVCREGATVFVPMDNELLCGRMRPILSRDEIEALLTQDETLDWPEDHNERRQRFQSILSAGDCTQILRMLRALYQHRRRLAERGKHLRSSDDQALREAEKLLSDEFAWVLQLSRQEALHNIRSCAE